MYGNDDEHQNQGRSGLPLQPQRMTIMGDVVVPLLQALAVSGALALLVGAFILLVAGDEWAGWARWGLAGKWFLGAMIVLLALIIPAFIYQHRELVTEPLNLLREMGRALAKERETTPEPQYMVIRPHARTPLLPATLEHEIRPIDPAVDPETRELYDFITRVWPTGNVSRDHCRDTLGITRAVWEKMVGGRRGMEGQESGRGVLARAGVVRQTAAGWEIAAPLDEALCITAPLESYANARAQLVRLGTGRTGQDGTDPSPAIRRPTAGE